MLTVKYQKITQQVRWFSTEQNKSVNIKTRCFPNCVQVLPPTLSQKSEAPQTGTEQTKCSSWADVLHMSRLTPGEDCRFLEASEGPAGCDRSENRLDEDQRASRRNICSDLYLNRWMEMKNFRRTWWLLIWMSDFLKLDSLWSADPPELVRILL